MTQDRLILTVEGLGFGGEGYATVDREDLRFISVPHTLPGDRVEVGVGQPRRGRAWAQIERWIERSEAHVDPQCGAYDRCSGCALRHMALEAERTWKRDAVVEILGRYGPPGAGDVPVEVVCAGARKGHRSRGRFSVAVTDEGELRLGLRSTALESQITDVRGCVAQSPRFRGLMAELGCVLDAHIEAARDIASVEIKIGAPGAALVLIHGQPDPTLLGVLSDWARLKGVSLGTAHEGDARAVVGDLCLHIQHQIGGSDRHAAVRVSPSSWLHATPGAAEALMAWVEARFAPHSHRFLLDLCAGTGTATFRLAPALDRLIAVDEDHLGLAAIAAAAKDAGLEQIETRAGRIGTVLRKLARELPANARPTGALINPMRRPLGADQLRFLTVVGVKHVVYLGPSAVSAAKDAATLAKMGFELHRAAAINLHPATGQTMLAFEAFKAQSDKG